MSGMTPAEFEAKMKEAVKLLSGESLTNRIGQIALAAAMKRTPVRTGNLRRSESYRAEGSLVWIGASADYARFVHEKQPFLQEGIEDSMPQIQDELRTFGQSIIEAIKG